MANEKADKKSESEVESSFNKVCAKVGSLLAQADCTDVLLRYKAATTIQATRDDAKYGANAISKMAVTLDLDRSSLYRYATVADTWTAEEFKNLVARSRRAKKALSWSHLEVLATVPDGRVRKSLVEKCLGESWSFAKLRSELPAKARESRPTVEDDGSQENAVAELSRFVNSTQRKFEYWTPRLAADLKSAKPPDSQVFEELETVIEHMEKLGLSMTKAADELRKALARPAPPSQMPSFAASLPLIPAVPALPAPLPPLPFAPVIS